jgi:hypothetical protein
VPCKGEFRFVSPYIRGLRSSEMLCEVGGNLITDVSGLSNDPIFRGRKTACRLKKGLIYCLEMWVTIPHKSRRVILEERASFNF